MCSQQHRGIARVDASHRRRLRKGIRPSRHRSAYRNLRSSHISNLHRRAGPQRPKRSQLPGTFTASRRIRLSASNRRSRNTKICSGLTAASHRPTPQFPHLIPARKPPVPAAFAPARRPLPKSPANPQTDPAIRASQRSLLQPQPTCSYTQNNPSSARYSHCQTTAADEQSQTTDRLRLPADAKLAMSQVPQAQNESRIPPLHPTAYHPNQSSYQLTSTRRCHNGRPLSRPSWHTGSPTIPKPRSKGKEPSAQTQSTANCHIPTACSIHPSPSRRSTDSHQRPLANNRPWPAQSALSTKPSC